MALQVLYARNVNYGPAGQQAIYKYDPVAATSKSVFTEGTVAANQPYSITDMLVVDGGAAFDKVWFFGGNTFDRANIWTTDGRANGTQALTTNMSAVAGQQQFLGTLFGEVFFRYNTATFGDELYSARADGNWGLVKDLVPGSGGSFPDNFTLGNNLFYFTATGSNGRAAVWASDGLSAGTAVIRQTAQFGRDPSDLYFSDATGVIYFQSDYKIYSATNTSTSVNVVMSGDPADHGGAYYYSYGFDPPYLIGEVSNGVLATAQRFDNNGFDGADYNGYGVWRVTSGQGVTQITTERNFSPTSHSVTSSSGQSYFTANDAVGTRLWFSNGSAGGAFPIGATSGLTIQKNPIKQDIVGAFVLDVLFFVAVENATGIPALYRVGAGNTAQRISSFTGANDGGDIRGLTSIGDHVYFFVQPDGASAPNLWRISGADGANPQLVASNVVEAAGVVGADLPTVNSVVGSDVGESVFGTADVDEIEARGGDDTLFGYAGADILNGGAGTDLADYSGDAARGGAGAVTVSLVALTATDGFGATDTLVSVEGAIGTAGADTMTAGTTAATFHGMGGNDTLTGGAGGDLMTGGPGRDTIRGHGGADVIVGDGDDDQLFGGDGVDTIYGGAGDDYLQADGGASSILDGGAGVDTLYGGAGNDYMIGGDGGDTLVGLGGSDSLYGGAGVDYLVAGDGPGSVLDGGAGANSLWGAGGNDYAVGGEGGDTIVTGAGSDYLFGLAGADTIYAGAGTDYIFGNSGNDFIYTDDIGQKHADFVYAGGGTGVDTIVDFTPGSGATHDTLVISPSSGLASFADVMANATQVGVYTVITMGADQVYLYNVQPFQLTAENVLIF